MNRATVDRSSAGKSSIRQCAPSMLGMKKDHCGCNALCILVHIVLLNLTWHCKYAQATA